MADIRIIQQPDDAEPGDGAADFEGDVEAYTALPTVVPRKVFNVTEQQHGDILDIVTARIVEENSAGEPELFNRDNEVIVTVNEADAKLVSVEPLDMTLRLLRLADWETGEKGRAVDPPYSITGGILRRSHSLIRRLPLLRSITGSPTFSADGVFETQPGYHPSTLSYYVPRGLLVPDVADEPTAEEIERAKNLLLVDVFGDFAFVSQAERAHSVAMLLQGFSRALMRGGNTPIYVVEANQPEVGKSYLVEVITTILLGETVVPTAIPKTAEEWDKSLGAKLIAAPPIIVFDNVDQGMTFTSGTLNALTTGKGMSVRKLGVSEQLELRYDGIICATGNNIRVGRDITRRIVRIRMERNPKKPKDWRHRNLREWCAANRGDLIWACATLVKAWLAAGKPAGKVEREFGSFIEWQDTIGGILDNAGIPGLLANRSEWEESVEDDSTTKLVTFYSRWWAAHQSKEKYVGELLSHVKDLGLIKSFDDAGAAGRELGYVLRDNKGYFVSGYAAVAGAKDRNGVRKWKLEREA